MNTHLPTVSDCSGCGLCCLHMGYPPFVGADGVGDPESHWQQMPQGLKDELQRYIESYHKDGDLPKDELDGPCVWYDPRRRICKHHLHRPNVCRDFRVGGKVCLQWREHYREKLVGNPRH